MLRRKLTEAGVPVAQQTFPGVTHEFFGMGAAVAKAKQAEDFTSMRPKASFVAPKPAASSSRSAARASAQDPPANRLRRKTLVASNRYVRYGYHAKTIAKDEAAVIGGIIATMTRKRSDALREGRADGCCLSRQEHGAVGRSTRRAAQPAKALASIALSAPCAVCEGVHI